MMDNKFDSALKELGISFKHFLKKFHIDYFLKVFSITVSIVLGIHVLILTCYAFVYMDASLVVSGLDVTSYETWQRAVMLVPYVLIPLVVASIRLNATRLHLTHNNKAGGESE